MLKDYQGVVLGGVNGRFKMCVVLLGPIKSLMQVPWRGWISTSSGICMPHTQGSWTVHPLCTHTEPNPCQSPSTDKAALCIYEESSIRGDLHSLFWPTFRWSGTVTPCVMPPSCALSRPSCKSKLKLHHRCTCAPNNIQIKPFLLCALSVSVVYCFTLRR